MTEAETHNGAGATIPKPSMTIKMAEAVGRNGGHELEWSVKLGRWSAKGHNRLTCSVEVVSATSTDPSGYYFHFHRTGLGYVAHAAAPDPTVNPQAQLWFAQMLAPDPRLANLRDELRDIAEEFLNLHNAWGTEFEACITEANGFSLKWGAARSDHPGWDGPRKPAASEFFHLRKTKRRDTITSWHYHDNDEDWRASVYTRTLRRSVDFEVFLQRFKAEVQP